MYVVYRFFSFFSVLLVTVYGVFKFLFIFTPIVLDMLLVKDENPYLSQIMDF